MVLYLNALIYGNFYQIYSLKPLKHIFWNNKIIRDGCSSEILRKILRTDTIKTADDDFGTGDLSS